MDRSAPEARAIELTAQEGTKRCGVVFIAQPGLEEDAEILRSILRLNKRNLGIYCSIDGTGTIELGDELYRRGLESCRAVPYRSPA